MTNMDVVDRGEDHKDRTVVYPLAVAQHRDRVEAEITPAWVGLTSPGRTDSVDRFISDWSRLS